MNTTKWTLPISEQVEKQKKKSCFASIGQAVKRFNPCLRPQRQSETLSKFLSQFKQVSLYHDPYFGEVFLLQSLSHNQQILLKKQKLHQSQLPARQRQIKQLESFKNNPHIVSQTMIQKLNKVGFLWSKVQLYLVYDFIVFDLQKQFEYRLAKKTRFSDRQIVSIIKGACKGYIHLQATDYASIRMNYIYFTRKGFVKIAHPQLFRYKTNLQCICQHDESKGIYLSPQQMYCLQKGQKNAILGWKSNSFVFGMVLLSLMSQQHLNQVYDYSSCYIDRSKIDQLLRNCKQIYPQKLVSSVQKLIQQRPQQRLTFRSLLNKITNTVDAHNQVNLQLLNEKGKPIQTDLNYGLGLNMNRQSLQAQPYGNYNNYSSIRQPQYHNYLSQIMYPKIIGTGPIQLQSRKVNANYGLGDQYGKNVLNQQMQYYQNRNSRYIGEVKGGDNNVAGHNVPYRDGKGYYKNQDGQIYVGDWAKGEMSGFGKLYWSQQKLRYEGQFQNGHFNGTGIQYNGDPNIVGFADEEDEPDHTFVRLQRNNWLKYQGNFKNDKREGQGVAHFQNGKWMGNFQDGQPNGQGVWTDFNNNRVQGVWVDGILQQ